MPLTQDEIKEVFKDYLRCEIDLAQAMNYVLHSKYQEGTLNLSKTISSLQKILEKIQS